MDSRRYGLFMRISADGFKSYKALATGMKLKGRLTGRESAKQIRKTDPTFSIVYPTGGAREKWVRAVYRTALSSRKPVRASATGRRCFSAPEHRVERL
jgi:hypothetical protein